MLPSPNLRLLERSAFYQGFSFFFLDFYIQILGVALNASALDIGIFTAAVFVAQIVSHPIAGVLADRIGRSKTLALGGFVRIISLVLVGVAFSLASPTLITIGRAIQGLAAGFFWTSSSAIVADETEGGGRSGEFGRMNLWVNRGMLVGAVGGLFLLPVRLDLPPYFFALAAAVSGVYALRIRPSQVRTGPVGDGLAQRALPSSQVTAGLALINFLNSAGFLPIASFLTVYITRTVFTPESCVNTAALLIAIANAPQVLFLAFVAPRLARIGDRMGRLRPLTVSILANLPISLGLIWIRELWHLAVLGLLFAAVGTIFSASYNSIIGDFYRGRRGFAYGGLNMSFSVGAALGATIGGLLFPLGWTTLVLVSIGIQSTALLGVVLVARGYRSPLAVSESTGAAKLRRDSQVVLFFG